MAQVARLSTSLPPPRPPSAPASGAAPAQPFALGPLVPGTGDQSSEPLCLSLPCTSAVRSPAEQELSRVLESKADSRCWPWALHGLCWPRVGGGDRDRHLGAILFRSKSHQCGRHYHNVSWTEDRSSWTVSARGSGSWGQCGLCLSPSHVLTLGVSIQAAQVCLLRAGAPSPPAPVVTPKVPGTHRGPGTAEGGYG